MSRKYLRSDMSEQEARFFTRGSGVLGEENYITGLFKIVGKFNELAELDRTEDILNYNPQSDLRFKYENRGYTDIGLALKLKYPENHINRRSLKNLSRKWCFTAVCISLDSGLIISELFTYIKSDTNLRSACQNYLTQVGVSWQRIMPIQYDFLCVRHTDLHKNYRTARDIINTLANVSL